MTQGRMIALYHKSQRGKSPYSVHPSAATKADNPSIGERPYHMRGQETKQMGPQTLLRWPLIRHAKTFPFHEVPRTVSGFLQILPVL